MIFHGNQTSTDIYSSLITRLIDLNRKQHKYFPGEISHGYY